MSAQTVQFEVVCHTVWGEKAAVCGSDAALGEWDVSRARVLEVSTYPLWTGSVDVSLGKFEFKYLVVRPEADGRLILVRWENNANRIVEVNCTERGTLALKDEFEKPDKSTRCYIDAGEDAAMQASKSSSRLACPRRQSNSGDGDDAGAFSPVKSLQKIGSGMLACLDVEPSMRLSRLVRSKSGDAFGMKYEVLAGNVLGTGMSGGVCVAKVRATGVEVALKTLPTTSLDETERKRALEEIQNQLSMDHPNICRLLEVYEEPDCLRLVMERLRGPDLYEHWSQKGQYSENNAAGCVRQICNAVAYCHSRGVCHRDLKLENFVYEDDSDSARLKMIDFGLSTFMKATMTDAVGTLYYVAPEVLKAQYDEKCDMWSLGVLTYVMLMGGPPFRGRTDRETAQLIRRGAYYLPEGRFSEQAVDFIQSLLRLNPALRLDAKGALDHPWLSETMASSASKDTSAKIDAAVLQGMRSFARSNALKRAVMNVVAPVATAEEVSKWADQFAALDPEGTGTIAVKDLTEQLQSTLSLSPAEAASISSALASADGSEEVSYSGFLAACLSAHTAVVEDSTLRELFERLDVNGDGLVSINEISHALAGSADLEELKADLVSSAGKVSFDEFRWLVLRPTHGLQSVLRATRGLESGWRVDTRLARLAVRGNGADAEAIDAARRENAAWRLWWLNGGQDASPSPTVTEDESDVGVPGGKSTRSIAENLEGVDVDKLDGPCTFSSTWSMKTAAAKTEVPGSESAAKAAREENLAWRQWNLRQAKDQSSEGSSPRPSAS
eukprot:TRINITY_DN30925_c0_g1_i1.p1 TRINITY_DN30925_c0_g1~~TRINITY_DN30925_c0_g1_i1.p1  ORF type:complete len:783 (+),score=161.21 TRINITY_DN30925_c0_g1_i1:84-2432(+)